MDSKDPLLKVAQNLSILQSQKFTGAVVIKLELADGGIRSCYFGTDQKIHPQEPKEKNKPMHINKNT